VGRKVVKLKFLSRRGAQRLRRMSFWMLLRPWKDILKALYGKGFGYESEERHGTQDVGEIFQEGVGFGAFRHGTETFFDHNIYDLNRIAWESRGSILSKCGVASLGLSMETLSFIEAMQRNNRELRV
jgi:hypothetical protein